MVSSLTNSVTQSFVFSSNFVSDHADKSCKRIIMTIQKGIIVIKKSSQILIIQYYKDFLKLFNYYLFNASFGNEMEVSLSVILNIAVFGITYLAYFRRFSHCKNESYLKIFRQRKR